MGRPLKPPSGHSRRGIPCQRRPRSGEKPSGVSAFVGVGRPSGPVPAPRRSGSSVLRRNPKTTASAVCRKAQACPAGSRPHPATVSHTQSIFSPRHVEYSVHVQFHVRGSPCPWTSWDPVAFNVEGGN